MEQNQKQGQSWRHLPMKSTICSVLFIWMLVFWLNLIQMIQHVIKSQCLMSGAGVRMARQKSCQKAWLIYDKTNALSSGISTECVWVNYDLKGSKFTYCLYLECNSSVVYIQSSQKKAPIIVTKAWITSTVRAYLLCFPDGWRHVFKVIRLFVNIVGWRGNVSITTFNLNTCRSIFIPGAPFFDLWLHRIRCLESNEATRNHNRFPKISLLCICNIYYIIYIYILSKGHICSLKHSALNFAGGCFLNTMLTCFGTDCEKSTVVGRVIWSPLSLRPLPLLHVIM